MEKIDNRLKTAISLGSNKLSNRINKEEKILCDWATGFIFNHIKEAIVNRHAEVLVCDYMLPHKYGFDRSFILTMREKLQVVKKHLEKVNGLSIGEVLESGRKWNNYGMMYDLAIAVSWNA